MTIAQRRTVLRACGALYGLAVAIAAYPLYLRPAAPGQLPGLMTALGLDAHASFRFFTGLVLLPLIATLAARPIAARLAADDSRPWARIGAGMAMICAFSLSLLRREVLWVALPAALIVAVCVLLRRMQARFSRIDLVLLPVTLCVYLAVMDVVPALDFELQAVTAVVLIFVLRLAVTGREIPALCFAFAPLGLVFQSHVFSSAARHSPWAPLLFTLVSPILVRLFVRDTPVARRRLGVARAIVYPIAVLAYASAISRLAEEGLPRADLFENSQHLTPASEMLRGERPYTDIIPPHGLIKDGLLDFVLLRIGPATAGHVIQRHGEVSALMSPAGYALGWALTGSPEMGLLAYFLGAALGTGGGTLRPLPSVITLVFLALAVRRRRPIAFAAAGAAVVLAILTSLDFGAYALIALAVAVFRYGPAWAQRRIALRFAAIGLAAAAFVAATGLLISGIFIDFMRVTLVEIPSLGAVYAGMPFVTQPELQGIRELSNALVAILHQRGFFYGFWFICLIAFIVRVTTPPPRTRRGAAVEALVVVLGWVVAAGISYAERHHFYFQFVMGPALVATLWMLWRWRWPISRSIAVVATGIVVMVATPTNHLFQVRIVRAATPPRDVVEVPEIRRARGAYYSVRDAQVIRIVADYFQRTLAPGETFFDFTNRGALFFLFNLDCPIRQVEPAFYETEERQREVIRRLTANPRVRVALIPDNANSTAIDGVPNAVRAPLVWQYLQTHFRPDYESEGVVFWRRID